MVKLKDLIAGKEQKVEELVKPEKKKRGGHRAQEDEGYTHLREAVKEVILQSPEEIRRHYGPKYGGTRKGGSGHGPAAVRFMQAFTTWFEKNNRGGSANTPKKKPTAEANGGSPIQRSPVVSELWGGDSVGARMFRRIADRLKEAA